MSSSPSRLSLLLLTALIILLAHISTAASYSPTASPVPTPAPSPKKKKTTPAAPVASPASPPVPDYLAPGPSTTDAGTDCMTLLFGAADCLSYVEEGSNLTAPDKACCPELATLVNTNPICLCQLLKKGNSFGIAIDMSRALTLPSACKVETPDPGLCACKLHFLSLSFILYDFFGTISAGHC